MVKSASGFFFGTSPSSAAMQKVTRGRIVFKCWILMGKCGPVLQKSRLGGPSCSYLALDRTGSSQALQIDMAGDLP